MARIQSTHPFHSAMSAEETNDMDGCVPHIGRDYVQSEGCTLYTAGSCHRDDLLFTDFGSRFLTLWVLPCELLEQNSSTIIRKVGLSIFTAIENIQNY